MSKECGYHEAALVGAAFAAKLHPLGFLLRCEHGSEELFVLAVEFHELHALLVGGEARVGFDSLKFSTVLLAEVLDAGLLVMGEAQLFGDVFVMPLDVLIEVVALSRLVSKGR